MVNSPYTSVCVRCSAGTYNPHTISLGEGGCVPRRVCDDKDHMMYESLGNATHDAVCTCDEGFLLRGEPDVCVPETTKPKNITADRTIEKTMCKVPGSVKEKFELRWSSFFIGGCAVFLTCFTAVGLWCFFVYCDRCQKDRKSDYKPVSWTNLRSKKQRILGMCHRDREFQNKCWLVALETLMEKVGPNWKELAYNLSRGTYIAIGTIELEHQDDLKGRTKALLQQWQDQYMKEPSDSNEVIGSILQAVHESGHADLHNQIVEEIWERFGDELKNPNVSKAKNSSIQDRDTVEATEMFYFTEEC
jgi:hypothetical protein